MTTSGKATEQAKPATSRSIACWADLPSAEVAKEWEAVAPGTFARIMDAVESAQRHEHRMDWVEMGLRLLGLLSGLAAIAILALTAVHLADHGAANQGLGIFGAGTASIIGAFLTASRLRSRE